jgi:membrane protein DedA with SNARE-associated domain
MRFKILVLIPAVGSALVVIFAGGLARSNGLSAILIAAILASGCLQIGYVCGAVVRETLMQQRAGNLRKFSLRAGR